MPHKKVSVAAVGLLALLFCAASFGLFRLAGPISRDTPPDISVAAGGGNACLTPLVLDALTGQPVSGAVVTVPGTSLCAVTDARGYTPRLNVPLSRDARWDALLPQTWSEALLIIRCDGYADTVLLCSGLYSDAAASPVIRLEPGSGQIFASAAPPAAWVSGLVQKYAP
ncbi:MAG: hypothetical protein IKM60_02700 [Clostridia bacterium]|nr:hypothetical protein [Clostridia bacterium]